MFVNAPRAKTMTTSDAESKAMKEITVIDPTSRYGKLSVPMSYTLDTKGRAEWVKCGGKLKKDLSICCLFQKGKCHVGERCFQVHVDRAYVIELRKKYANLTTCCHGCGDVHSDTDAHRRLLQGSFTNGKVAISFGGCDDSVDIQANRLANTIGLEDALKGRYDGVVRRRDGTLVFSFSKVCRLHLKNACKYGRDCKNLHICHKCAGQLGQEGTAENTNACHFEERRDARIRHASVSDVPSASSAVEMMTSRDSEDSLCATPELRSRTSTPSLTPSVGSPVESCVSYSVDKGEDYVNGIAISPMRQVFASTVHQQAAPQPPTAPHSDLGFLARFQTQWHQGNTPSTESLQIIFGGFPTVTL
jgi:hypothetical protein